MTAPYITCPVCGMTSYSPGDVSHRYCAHCHRFHDEMTGDEIAKATAEARRRGERGQPGRDYGGLWWPSVAITLCQACRFLGTPWTTGQAITLDALTALFLAHAVRRIWRDCVITRGSPS